MTGKRPQHAAMKQFAVVDDCLQIGSIPLVRLSDRIGTTPFYAYDRAAITARVNQLRAVLPPEVHLHYAVKANPMPAVVQHLSALVDGLDVASAGEMMIALDAGTQPERISFAGPGKTDTELSRAASANIVINIESEREVETLARIAKSLSLRPRVAVRVNPDFELKMSGMKMSGGPKQFGVDAERVPELLDRIGKSNLEFVGFHIFSGSQNLRADAINDSQCKAVELAIRLAERAPAPIRLLNIGGGFGIPYFPGDQSLDIEPIGENLRRLAPVARARMPQAQLVIELGRYLVGEAGIYVSRIVDRKVSRGVVYLVTDGGLHHHLAASGNFGQVIRKNYPVVVGNRIVGQEREVVSVVGPLCTPLDLLADNLEMAKADVGDLVVVFQSGAYGLTASPQKFLCHPLPVEALV